MHRNLTLRGFASATVFIGMVLAGGVAFADRDASEELRKMFGMGVHHYNAGQFAKAYESLSRCIEGKTQDPSVYYYRGLSLMQLGREEDASEDFQRGAEMEIRSPKSQNQVGYDLMNIQGRLRLKLEEYRTDAKLAAYQYKISRDDINRQSPGQTIGGMGYGGGYSDPLPPPGSSAVEGGVLDDYTLGGLDDGGADAGVDEGEPLDLGSEGGDDFGDGLDDGAGLGGGFDDDDAGLGGGFDDDDAGLGGGFDDDDAGLGGGFDDDGAGLGGGFDDDGAGLGGGFDDDGAGLGGGFDDDGAGLGGGFDEDDAGLGGGFDDDGAGLGGGFDDDDALAVPVEKGTTKKPAADPLDEDGEEFGPTPFDDDEEEGAGLDLGGEEEPEEPEEAEDPFF